MSFSRSRRRPFFLWSYSSVPSLSSLPSFFPSLSSSSVLECLSPLDAPFLPPIPPTLLMSFPSPRHHLYIPLFLILSLSVPPFPSIHLSTLTSLYIYSLFVRVSPLGFLISAYFSLTSPLSSPSRAPVLSIFSFSTSTSFKPLFLFFRARSVLPTLPSLLLFSPTSPLTFSSVSLPCFFFFLILSPQPSPLTHMLLSLRLPSSAPPAVSYSDSDIITLVVTGFICTLWTYTSAWLIVQGPGPAEPRPDRDRVTDRMVLKTTPARVPLDIFFITRSDMSNSMPVQNMPTTPARLK